MGFKYGVQLKGEPLAFNALVFATREEADAAGRELLSRWYSPIGYEVIETTDTVNYHMVNGQPERI